MQQLKISLWLMAKATYLKIDLIFWLKTNNWGKWAN
jgi:hypothetical protein